MFIEFCCFTKNKSFSSFHISCSSIHGGAEWSLVSHHLLDLDCVMNSFIYIFIHFLSFCWGLVLRKISIIMFMLASQRLFFLLLLFVSFLHCAESEFVFLSVFIMTLILHSTDYFMLHFAPCRCSMSFIMISILEHTKKLASRPKVQWKISYLFSCSDDGDDDDEKYISDGGEMKLNQGEANNNSFVTINNPRKKNSWGQQGG